MKPEDGKNKDKNSNEPEMFYMENGFMVFTAAYHLRRGYCCRNGCRHCPYGFKKPQS
jgi:hypothetical protein